MHHFKSLLFCDIMAQMAVRGTSEIVFGTPLGTFWDHSGRFLGGEEGGGGDYGGSSGLSLSMYRAMQAVFWRQW